MNKIKCYLLSFLCLVIYSCSNEDFSEDTYIPVDYDAADISPVHFYGIAYPGMQNSTRGIAQRDNLWYPGTAIKVKFLNDPYNVADVVKAHAAEWEKYANISFKFIESGDAHVRIGFDWNDERYITWSYIGTDCKMVTNQNEATMSFAYWDSSTAEEIKGDVLRAFGQVLGLELEHRHLSFEPGWTARIADYWEGEIEDVTWDNLQKYVFTPLEQNDVIQTAEYDEESIMIWPFSSRYAKNTSRSFNYELSQQDKEFINTLYPKPKEEPIVTMTTINTGRLDLLIKNNKEIIIDWGDSARDTLNASLGIVAVSHEFMEENNVIRFYGETDALIHFEIGKRSSGLGATTLDVSGSVQLEVLSCIVQELTELDITKNTQLRSLSCGGNQLSALDVSNNIYLSELSCENNLFVANLDVSNNTQLVSLNCAGSNLSNLDLTNNPLLNYLYCEKNHLTELNLSNNVLLNYIYCVNNQLTSLDISKNVNLKNLYCGNNLLTTLNVSENANLTSLSCSSNSLTALDISKNVNLKDLYCDNNSLTALDVSENANLTTLSCNGNLLTALDFSENGNLTSLNCVNNLIESLDVTNNIGLVYLNCGINRLSSLDVSNNVHLTSLMCYSNQLSSIDITRNIKLSQFYCYSNSIQELDLSMNDRLSTLNCSNNQLIALDVSNNSIINKVYCAYNPFLQDLEVMQLLVQALPIYSTPTWGTLSVSRPTLPYIGSICYEKNWMVQYEDDRE